MIDTRTPEQRSKLMSCVRGKDTDPEMVARWAEHHCAPLQIAATAEALPNERHALYVVETALPVHRSIAMIRGFLIEGDAR